MNGERNAPTPKALAVQQDCYRLLESITALRRAFDRLGQVANLGHEGIFAWAQQEGAQWSALRETLKATRERIEELERDLIEPYAARRGAGA